jgi:hypothetical protein
MGLQLTRSIVLNRTVTDGKSKVVMCRAQLQLAPKPGLGVGLPGLGSGQACSASGLGGEKAPLDVCIKYLQNVLYEYIAVIVIVKALVILEILNPVIPPLLMWVTSIDFHRTFVLEFLHLTIRGSLVQEIPRQGVE